MFEFIRTHSRLALGFLLLLVIPSFVVFGIEGYSRFSGPANDTVAKVAGQTISRAEWDQAHDRAVDRIRRQQPDADLALFNDPKARLETLDALMRERVLSQAAADLHLYPTVPRMARLFDGDPGYSGLRGADGKLSRELLAQMGMSPEMFDQQLRQQYGMRQVLAGVALSAVAPASVAAQSLDALLQRREVQMQRFDPGTFRAKVAPTDAELEAYYRANEGRFRTPEQARIEYVVLDTESLGRSVTVSEDDARKVYEASAARFTATEERRSSHILVKAAPDAPAAERAAAKAKAEALLQQVKDKPASFAEVARKNSDDPASAAVGGDLEFAARETLAGTSAPLADAVFGLAKVGDIGGPVQTEFGYHVVMLTAVRGGQKKPFAEVRAEIEQELKKSRVRWPEAAQQFSDLAYEQSESLKPIVDKFKLEPKTATVARAPAPGASGALASPRLLAAVFSNEVLKNKRNTDAVEIGPNQLVAARLVEHLPSRVQPLPEVRERVREALVTQKAAALARQEGEARLAALKKSPTEALPETVTISRTQTLGAPPSLLEAVMRPDPAKLPEVAGVDLGEAGYVVLRITRVLPRDLPPGGTDPMQQQYAQAWAAAETEAYLAALKKRYKAEVKPEARTAAAAAAASAAGS